MITAPVKRSTAAFATASTAKEEPQAGRSAPELNARQLAFHGGLTRSGNAFSMEKASKLYSNRKQPVGTAK